MHLRPAGVAPPTPQQNRQRYLAQGVRREHAAQQRNAELAALAGTAPPDLEQPL
jgi:hypothetical protein